MEMLSSPCLFVLFCWWALTMFALIQHEFGRQVASDLATWGYGADANST